MGMEKTYAFAHRICEEGDDPRGGSIQFFCLKCGHALEFSELVRQQHKPFAARMGA